LRIDCLSGTRHPKEATMTTLDFAPARVPVTIPAIPVRELLPWAIFISLLAVVILYFIGVEEGAMAIFNGMYVHEFVHDSRHLLGFPCH
jgi:hypothetical protein